MRKFKFKFIASWQTYYIMNESLKSKTSDRVNIIIF